GSLGGVFFSEEDFWPHDTTLWVKDFHGNDPRFVYYFLQTLGLAQFDVGAANPTLNRNHIHVLPVVIPPFSAQRKIASVLSAFDARRDFDGKEADGARSSQVQQPPLPGGDGFHHSPRNSWQGCDRRCADGDESVVLRPRRYRPRPGVHLVRAPGAGRVFENAH